MESAGLLRSDSYVHYRDKKWLLQILMALRDKFESCHGSDLLRSPLPFVDGLIQEGDPT